MRKMMKKMMATVMLAVLMSLGAQTTLANAGVILSDRQSGNAEVKTPDVLDILLVYIKTGVILSDRQGVILSD